MALSSITEPVLRSIITKEDVLQDPEGTEFPNCTKLPVAKIDSATPGWSAPEPETGQEPTAVEFLNSKT